MKMQFNRQIGSKVYTFTAEGRDLMEMIEESEKISFRDVKKCDMCGQSSLALRTTTANTKDKGEIKFVKICCLNPECRSSLTLSASKAGAYYIKRDKETGKYNWYKPQNRPQQPSQFDQAVSNDDVNF